MVPCSGIVWGDLWAKIFRIFIQTHICIYTGAEKKGATLTRGEVSKVSTNVVLVLKNGELKKRGECK